MQVNHPVKLALGLGAITSLLYFPSCKHQAKDTISESQSASAPLTSGAPSSEARDRIITPFFRATTADALDSTLKQLTEATYQEADSNFYKAHLVLMRKMRGVLWAINYSMGGEDGSAPLNPDLRMHRHVMNSMLRSMAKSVKQFGLKNETVYFDYFTRPFDDMPVPAISMSPSAGNAIRDYAELTLYPALKAFQRDLRQNAWASQGAIYVDWSVMPMTAMTTGLSQITELSVAGQKIYAISFLPILGKFAVALAHDYSNTHKILSELTTILFIGKLTGAAGLGFDDVASATESSSPTVRTGSSLFIDAKSSYRTCLEEAARLADAPDFDREIDLTKKLFQFEFSTKDELKRQISDFTQAFDGPHGIRTGRKSGPAAEIIQVNLGALFSSPPGEALKPNSLSSSAKTRPRMTVKLLPPGVKSGVSKSVEVMDYFAGIPTSWALDAYRPYFPNLQQSQVPVAVEIIKSLGFANTTAFN